MAAALLAVLCLEVAVLVPAAVAELDEPHAGLDEPAGQQALPAEVVGRRHRRCRTADASPRSRPRGPSASAASPCMRKASSYESMTPSTSGLTCSALQRRAVERLEQVELLPLAAGLLRGLVTLAIVASATGRLLTRSASPGTRPAGTPTP